MSWVQSALCLAPSRQQSHQVVTHGVASDASCSLGSQLLGHLVMQPIQWKGWLHSQFNSYLPEVPCNQKRGNEKGDKIEHLEMRSVTAAKF